VCRTSIERSSWLVGGIKYIRRERLPVMESVSQVLSQSISRVYRAIVYTSLAVACSHQALNIYIARAAVVDISITPAPAVRPSGPDRCDAGESRLQWLALTLFFFRNKMKSKCSFGPTRRPFVCAVCCGQAKKKNLSVSWVPFSGYWVNIERRT
jgi:hypothetical protein